MDSFGIYSAAISFDGDGDVIGLSGEITLIWNTGYAYLASKDAYIPNIKRFDWSPDGSQIVLVKRYHNDIFQYVIFIVDMVEPKSEIDLGKTGYRVKWSPDGSKIAFLGGGLRTINPDGTDEQVIVAGSSKGKYDKRVDDEIDWSPESSHLVYTWALSRLPNSGIPEGRTYVYRVEVNGDNPTSMTDDLYYYDHDARAISHAWR